MSSARTTPVELVAESEPRFAEEENALLLVRLRAVTFLLSAGLALVLVRDLIVRPGPGLAVPGRRDRSPWCSWPRCSRPRGRARHAG